MKGNSIVDDTKIDLCMEMMKKAKRLHKTLLLPVDSRASKIFPDPIDNPKVEYKEMSVKEFDKNYEGLDAGPETIKQILEAMSKAKTILWNGPIGLFENQNFAVGTYCVAKEMALLTKKGVVTIVGGGDSASAINQFGLAKDVTHVSTGGGASLEFLKGEPLPGIECLSDK